MIGEGVLLSKALCAVGGGEGVGRTFSRETALYGGSVRSVLVGGVGLGKRQWLDEELRVAATAHSIMLQCQFSPSNALTRPQPPQMIEPTCKHHFSERVRFYLTGSLKLRKPLNYDLVIAMMNTYSGTTPSVYIRSMTVNLPEEGGTTTSLNSCLFNLEYSDPAMPHRMLMSGTLNVLIRRTNPSSCDFYRGLASSSKGPPSINGTSSGTDDCFLRSWGRCLEGGERVNSRESTAVSGMQRLPIYNIQSPLNQSTHHSLEPDPKKYRHALILPPMR